MLGTQIKLRLRKNLLCLCLAALVVPALTSPRPTPAQDKPKKAALAMRAKVYDRLSKAQVAAEAEDYPKAHELLRKVEKMKNLDPHEAAQLYTAWGYIYFAEEKYPQSIDAYEKVLAIEDIPESMEATTLYTLAQLQFQVENYEGAVDHLGRWLDSANNPGPGPFVLLGQAYYQLGKYKEAIVPVERALQVAAAREHAPKENWYSLLRSLYFETENYPKLVETLSFLVTKFPQREYWLHLAAAYGEMGQERRQLATYELAYEQGYLTDGREVLNLAQLLLQSDVPYRAGTILEKAIASERVESSAQNWRLLSQAWILAHEDAKAVEALTKAASLSNDGELDARLAQCHANLDHWESAVRSVNSALKKGVSDPHELHILAGMAFYELENFSGAKESFREAQKSPDGRKVASQWLSYIESEEIRLADIQRSLR